MYIIGANAIFAEVILPSTVVLCRSCVGLPGTYCINKGLGLLRLVMGSFLFAPPLGRRRR